MPQTIIIRSEEALYTYNWVDGSMKVKKCDEDALSPKIIVMSDDQVLEHLENLSKKYGAKVAYKFFDRWSEQKLSSNSS